MADKQISQLPLADITMMQNVPADMVAQFSGYSVDYRIDKTLLLNYVGANITKQGSLGGSANPDPAAGNNGDFYFQSNGAIYQKVNGAWILRVTLTLPSTQPYPVTIPGSGTPTTLTAPTGYYNEKAYVIAGDGGADWTRIKKSGGSFILDTFGTDTVVVYI